MAAGAGLGGGVLLRGVVGLADGGLVRSAGLAGTFCSLRRGFARTMLRIVAGRDVGAVHPIVPRRDMGIVLGMMGALVMLPARRDVPDVVMPVAVVDVDWLSNVCRGAIGHWRNVCWLGDVG